MLSVLCIVVIAGVAGCYTGGARRAGRKPVLLRPVRYVIAHREKASLSRTFSGTARAGVEARLSFKVPGTVRKIFVSVGDRLKAGQPIARLDDEDYLLKVQQAEASLFHARAAARNARAEYGRVRSLYENKNVSRSRLDAARAKSEEASATVLLLGRQLEQAKLRLDYTWLRAPSDCLVASVLVEENENVAAGQDIVRVAYGDKIEVELTVPESFIGRVSRGMKVFVSFDAVPGKLFSASVTEVGVAATGTATAYPVVVRLDGGSGVLRSGMAASVTFHVNGEGSGGDVFYLPPSSVSEDDEGRYVYVLREYGNGTAVVERRRVETGAMNSRGIAVLSGLDDGEPVVTAGVSKLRDGMKVKTVTAGTCGDRKRSEPQDRRDDGRWGETGHVPGSLR